MNKTDKIIISIVIAAIVGAYFFPHVVVPTPVQQPILGASAGTEHYNEENFYNGLKYNKIAPQSTGISTTTPALFKAAAGGFFTVAAGATSFTASTTAIDANTDINIQQISTSTAGSTLNATLLGQLGNLICNTTAATNTPVVSIFASTTNTSLNGFTVKLLNAPITSPACFSWSAQGY